MELPSNHLNPNTPIHRRPTGKNPPYSKTRPAVAPTLPQGLDHETVMWSIRASLGATDKSIKDVERQVVGLTTQQKSTQQIMEHFQTVVETLDQRVSKLEDNNKRPYSLWSNPNPRAFLEPRPPGWVDDYSPIASPYSDPSPCHTPDSLTDD